MSSFPYPLRILELDHASEEFDAAYDLLSRNIGEGFLEKKEFLWNRLRVRDQGPGGPRERLLVQEGYTLHLLAAIEARSVVGTIYGHLISRIGRDNASVGFVTYLAVAHEHRRKGIGTLLLGDMKRLVDRDAARLTGRHAVGMVYEIEAEGKEGIKGLVRARGAWPLDIVYHQPAVRETSSPEPMHLWFQPFDRLVLTAADAGTITYPAEFVRSLVLNLFTMEYVGPEFTGFDRSGMPYREFLRSVQGRTAIGFGGCR